MKYYFDRLDDNTKHGLKAIAIKCAMLVATGRKAKREVYSDEILHYIVDAFELGMKVERAKYIKLLK